MGRFTYYSPALIGAAITATFAKTLTDSAPAMFRDMPWLWVTIYAVVVGILFQILMVASQGVFAQVLPVPGGRSIRGRAAVAGGTLLDLGIGALAVAAFLHGEGLRLAAMILAIVSGAALIAFGGLYFWSMPLAVRDFADDPLD